SSPGMQSIARAPNEIRYCVMPWLPCPGGLLLPRLNVQTNGSLRIQRSTGEIPRGRRSAPAGVR
ncbi:MAG TPA: hypothetical protein VHZ03_12885, partial [Trebonia sp.]|nr:hypothetical protein [Trebonia sp.]